MLWRSNDRLDVIGWIERFSKAAKYADRMDWMDWMDWMD